MPLSLVFSMLRLLFIQVAQFGEVKALIEQFKINADAVLLKHRYQVLGYGGQAHNLIHIVELKIDSKIVIGLATRLKFAEKLSGEFHCLIYGEFLFVGYFVEALVNF